MEQTPQTVNTPPPLSEYVADAGKRASRLARGSRDAHSARPQVDQVLADLERSKYAIRIVLLLHRNGEMSLSGILRSIRTSPSTVVRALQMLEMRGFALSTREASGRRRRFYSLTPLGAVVATHSPVTWNSVSSHRAEAGEGSLRGVML